MLEVAVAMAGVHSIASLIHRDLKPANILCSEDMKIVKVSDFGISTLDGGDRTAGSDTFESPLYSAPEQASATIDTKLDIWAFGIMLIEVTCCYQDGEDASNILWRDKDGDEMGHPQVIALKKNFCRDLENDPGQMEYLLSTMLPCVL